MDKIEFSGCELTGYCVQLPKSKLLFITAPRGVLGCGFFDVATADRIGEAVAVVSGVKSYDDMLRASVVRCSKAAADLGISCGMTGAQALSRLL